MRINNMEININIKDYLSEDEIKEVCKNALYSTIRDSMRGLNVYDIIANISYAEVAKMVDDYIGKSDYCKNAIAEKVPELISNLSSFIVFRQADTWERKNSVGYDILTEEVIKARPLIRQRIEQIIAEYEFAELNRDEIAYTLAETIKDMLFERSKQ